MGNLVGRAKGGAARALALSSEERREISMKGVEAKKARALLVPITHEGQLKLGGFSLPCYVTRSGGSTGEPKFSVYDGHDWEHMISGAVRLFRASGKPFEQPGFRHRSLQKAWISDPGRYQFIQRRH